ncbi:MAG TPA: hypothetical protein VFP58_05065 [Candidatus Eisenbacteria bacterium]|nr:hypothetical protein [Candidatus Eisenbacteria bacterium]
MRNAARGVIASLAIGVVTMVQGGASIAAERPPTHGMALDSVAVLVASDLLAGAELPEGRPIVIATPVPGDTLGLLTHRLVERLRGRGAVVRLSAYGMNGAPVPSGTGASSPGTAYGGLSGALGAPSTGTFGSPGTIAPDSVPQPEDFMAKAAPPSPAPSSAAPAPARDPLRAPGTVQLQVQVDGSAVSYVRRLGKFPFGTKGYERLSAMRAAATLLDPATGEVFWTRSASRSLTDEVRKGDVAYAASGSGRLNPPVPKGGTRWLEPLIVVGVVAGLVVLFYSNRN